MALALSRGKIPQPLLLSDYFHLYIAHIYVVEARGGTVGAEGYDLGEVCMCGAHCLSSKDGEVYAETSA